MTNIETHTVSGPIRRDRRFRRSAYIIAASAFLLLYTQEQSIWAALLRVGIVYCKTTLPLILLYILMKFVILRLLAIRRTTPDANTSDWYRAYLANLRLADIITGFVTLCLTLTCFSVFKSAVVGANGYVYDPVFIAWDRAIFGRDAWEVTHGILPSAVATKWIDALYHPLFLPMILGYLICVSTDKKPALRYTYMLSYLASFVIIGMVMAAAMSSAGPIFEGTVFGDGTVFAAFHEQVGTQNEESGPFTFLFAYNYLLSIYTVGKSQFAGGISAMPSMHIVLAWLCVFAAWHLGRIVGAVFTVYGFCIWFGSVHLGWHYFVDGLVALIVLTVIWGVMGRLVGLYGPQTSRATT